ncbi:MAG: hypothetical protein ABIT58_09245 [Ferruginibacter sp.]
MSLDNFQLPPFLAGELYKNSLVDLNSKQLKNKSLKGNGDLVYLGSNKKHILIIVNVENAVYLPEEDLNFLIDILTACKRSLADTALINFHKNPGLSYKLLMQHFNPETIICLDVNLAALGFPLEFPYYQVQKYNNQSYLSAPALKKLASDKQEKMQLWNCLKKIFSI